MRRADGTIENLDVGTFCNHYSGDILECSIGAAGGFGNPFERDIEKVREDVSDVLVSIEGARKDYGVIIDASALEVDYKATEQLR
ncbi:hydantoinase B/oxoprolinase family protein, partial [Chloroflexota bacterium]